MTELAATHANSHIIRKNRETFLIFLSIAVVIVGAIFLNVVGQYALVGRHPFQFFADSNTYHDVYNGFRPSPEGFIDISYNFLGPMLILSLAGGSIYLVLIANVLMFTLSMIFICRALDLDPVRASAIQFLSPLTVFSLLSVNKEIIAFPVFACLILGYRQRSVMLVLAALVISILARWQLTAFCIVLIGLYFIRNTNRYAVLSLLLMAISVTFYMMQDLLEPVLQSAELSIAVYTEGSGLFERLIDLQNDGFYFAVAPVKAAHLLFSLGFHIDAIMNPIDVYNDQIIGSYCLMNFIMFLVLVARRRFVLRNDLIMISLVYLIVFALTPIYAPRYFYPVTILWALVLAGAKGGVVPVPGRAIAYAR